MSQQPDSKQVVCFLTDLQNAICKELSNIDGSEFKTDHWTNERGNGTGITRVLSGGQVIEKGAVLFSHIYGRTMPNAATNKRPELAGKPFQAMGVSVVMHPRNPFVPTSHMNVRFFIADKDSDHSVWWFGGGYDLTPYYGFHDDVVHWHQTARQACQGLGDEAYRKYKKWCDEYFYLPHRGEPRGVGGLFFDDLNAPDFATCFAFFQSVGHSYQKAYLPILHKRKDHIYKESHRQWQLLRRGRYVEFNLLYDRGTLFGLQSGGRAESILMSMPPLVAWDYQVEPQIDSEEANLLQEFLVTRDWL